MQKVLQRLQQLIQETGALQYGDFLLASGVRSTFYFDGRRLTYHPEGALLIGRLLSHALAGTGAQAAGGLTMGADPIATAVAVVSQQEGRPILAFSIRKEPKAHGARRLIEGSLPEKQRVDVAILEDVITTGASVLQAIRAVEAEGHRVVKVLALVDRCQGGSEMLQREGYKMESFFYLDAQGQLSSA